MKLSTWIFIGIAATGLTTGTWAQHGGGAHGGAAGHDPDFDSGTHDSSARSAHDQSHDTANTNFESRLANNPNLASRLQALLPPNTTLQAAAAGFKNQGQFIAALHVSHNLGIPFDQLKTDMTGPNHDSLGQAIHALRPDLNSKTVSHDVKVAGRQAKEDLRDSTETADLR